MCYLCWDAWYHPQYLSYRVNSTDSSNRADFHTVTVDFFCPEVIVIRDQFKTTMARGFAGI